MSWWSNLSRGERATFFACFGGWALDAFDYQFYTFVIPTLRKEWKISAGQAWALAAAAPLPSALGGWVARLPPPRAGGGPGRPGTILRFWVFPVLSGSYRAMA